MHSASWFNIYQYQVQCNSLHSSMWPYLYFYKWIRCHFLWVAMFLCYCFLAIVNTLKSLLGKINHWHRNMHLFFFRCLRPYNSEHLKSEIIKKAHCHSGPASKTLPPRWELYILPGMFETFAVFSWIQKTTFFPLLFLQYVSECWNIWYEGCCSHSCVFFGTFDPPGFFSGL